MRKVERRKRNLRKRKSQRRLLAKERNEAERHDDEESSEAADEVKEHMDTLQSPARGLPISRTKGVLKKQGSSVNLERQKSLRHRLSILPRRQTLPPLEETPLLGVRFTSKATTRLQELVEERLHQGGLVTLQRVALDDHEGKRLVLTLTTTQEMMEKEAELIHLMKKTSDTDVLDHFTVKHRQRFCDVSVPYRDCYGLFSACDWSLLANRMLDNITVLPPNEEETELSRILDTEYRADTLIHLERDESAMHLSAQSSGLSDSTRGRLHEHGEQSASLRHVLLTYDLVDVVTNIHLPQVRQHITRKTWFPMLRLNPPIDLIQSYYGWEVAFYFAWMGMLSQWLVFPGVIGLAVDLFRRYRNDTTDTDEYTPFYGIVGFFWAILFLRFWDRYEHRLAFKWGTFSLSPYERQKFFAVRPEFRGFLRQSPVTGKPETYYPNFRRRLKYVFGAMVTVAMLGVAFFLMILSININGYIQPESNPGRWNEEHPHPFHVPVLAVLADEGHIFDRTSAWRSYLPVIIHVLGIKILNYIYSLTAEKLTAWENHETKLNHSNSLILKRFLFEAFDSYLSLFYLAFYERDVERLRLELAAVFQIDTIRRLLFECIIPMVVQHFTIRRREQEERQRMTDESDVPRSDIPGTDQILQDLEKDSYEQFDDYMEIVIQLGYVTLFASAYPLASLVSIAANWVEVRSDCYKVANLCRRATVLRSSGLGMWRDLMASIIWMSALTNCLLVGFSSDQLMHYLPAFYIRDESGYTDMGHANSWIVVFVIFGLERFLIFFGLLIHAIVPEIPEDIQDKLERQHYIKMLEIEQEAYLAKASAKTKRD